MYSRQVRGRKIGYKGLPERPQAVALGYDPEKDPAPRVLAAGQGELAEQILKVARENGIHIRQDPLLAAALATVDVGQAIHPELYALVAEVLAFVYRIQNRKVG